MDPELNPTTANNSLMYQAIVDDKLEDLKLLLENGINVNEPIITTGKFAGFTALHVACMKNKDDLVELLVNDYKADVNAMAADGTEPIHLACFYVPLDGQSNMRFIIRTGIKTIKILVEANANVNAKFGQEIFFKHVKNREWCPDFGDKMPLAPYAVIYNKPLIIGLLKKVNVDIISLKNKTLLMYAVEYADDYTLCILDIISHVKDPGLMDKLMNHRDDDDVSLIHYPFHPKKYGRFRYLGSRMSSDDVRISSRFIIELPNWGADMYALIKNDSATFLPNLLAYRSDLLLMYALPYYTSMSLSRVLYYATVPIDKNSQHLINTNSESERLDHLKRIRRNQKLCIAIILKDLVFRSVFRSPVPEQQVKLKDELIAKDEFFRKIVNVFKLDFIEKEFQERFIEFGENKMTMCDFLLQVFDDKKLKFLAREENLSDALDKVVEQTDINLRFSFYAIYQDPIKIRIKDAKERLRLLENLKKISALRKAIPLPFELISSIAIQLDPAPAPAGTAHHNRDPDDEKKKKKKKKKAKKDKYDCRVSGDFGNEPGRSSRPRNSSDSMTLYDLVIKVFNKKSLKLLVKDDQFVKDYDRFPMSKIRRRYDQFLLLQTMDLKILTAHKRRKIMDKVEKISQLKKVIPSPYEVILMIIEYNTIMPKMHTKSVNMIKAVKNGDWNVIDQFVAKGGDINASLRKTGPQAGYTALHFAILSGNYRFDMERLIKTYGVDVNCVGADGAQPIHLACLQQNYRIIQILLESGADSNAELTKVLVEKYKSSQDWKWSDEFGKMTLFVFFNINSNYQILRHLVRNKANIEITGKNNKTLLMYGAQRAWPKHLEVFTEEYGSKCKPEFINARDDYGRHAVHYLLPNEKFGEFRYLKNTYISPMVWELRRAGADINAMIDNDPDTLLLNKVAYRCDYRMLEKFLELRYPFPAEGRPLHYFMIPVDPEKFVENSNDRREVEKIRNKCLKLILENYTLRREFGFFVPEEEIKLMDQLIAKKAEVKKIVADFQEDFINTYLFIPFSGSMTLYALVIKAFNKRSLKLLIKNDKLVEDYDDFFLSNIRDEYNDKFWLFNSIFCKVRHAHKRRQIMEKVENISQLKKVIPLPYEVIFMTVEDNNKTLLMYGAQIASTKYLNLFTEEKDNKCRLEFLNARDDHGRHAMCAVL
ncbi:Similar to Rnasel: 2-5A-dependent ribonuclease (Mus musculus) [Cotesia congregata]|uniref:Similar to Rnasel: 2-5A-dependent ribonuclease (Mus musculus) n=1 Tax=Cotesia congregata TaxID=51543 RepID=A0A8J2H9Z4_COTCN|nr:Similar to Rnasel: 2-5A-dependent ribonuclease (Mus musculus) [Cotesia congregata]